MQIYKVGLPEIVIAPLSSKLKSALDIGPAVWLIPGGSNIKNCVAIMEKIDTDLTTNLTVALTDERYGSYGHPDSNWAQLRQLGFDPKKARVLEVLNQTQLSLAETAKSYSDNLEAALDEANEVIGLFGMGSDGHIAGILPGSSAANESLPDLVTAYESQPYTRITLTFSGICRVNSAFLVAFGPEKHQALDSLINQDLPLASQPAQIIKSIREAYVYNDQIEGKQQ